MAAQRSSASELFFDGGCIVMTARSRLLLLAGPTSVDTAALRGNTPDRTFEYLGSRRPILFVGDPNSDVAELVRPFPYVKIVVPGAVNGARAALLALLRQSVSPSLSCLERFTSRLVARGLAETLNRASR